MLECITNQLADCLSGQASTKVYGLWCQSCVCILTLLLPSCLTIAEFELCCSDPYLGLKNLFSPAAASAIDCIQLVVMEYKILAPSPQLGTTLKGHHSSRAPHGIS